RADSDASGGGDARPDGDADFAPGIDRAAGGRHRGAGARQDCGARHARRAGGGRRILRGAVPEANAGRRAGSDLTPIVRVVRAVLFRQRPNQSDIPGCLPGTHEEVVEDREKLWKKSWKRSDADRQSGTGGSIPATPKSVRYSRVPAGHARRGGGGPREAVKEELEAI